MNRRGFSLLELCLAMILLSVGLIVSFSLFERGTRAVYKSEARLGLSDDARRVLASIGSDLRKTDLMLAQTIDDASRQVTGLSGTPVTRAAICYATLSDWNEPTRFNSDTAQIYWDRYTVVYATRNNPGQLVLQLHTPALTPPATFYELPLDNLTSLVNDDPSTNAGSVLTRTLCSNVESFEANLEPDGPEIRLKLILARRGSKKSGGRQIDERAEALMTYPAYNSAAP